MRRAWVCGIDSSMGFEQPQGIGIRESESKDLGRSVAEPLLARDSRGEQPAASWRIEEFDDLAEIPPVSLGVAGRSPLR